MSVGANIRYTGIFIENSNGIINPAVDQVRYLANSHVWQTWGAGINSNLPLKTINAIGNHNTVMALSNLNVGIGTVTPLSKLHVDTGSLGGTIGNTLDHIRTRCTSTNTHNFRIFEERHTTGSDWTTTSLVMQRVIDITNQGFIKFGVAGANGGLTLGAANTEIIRLSDAGNVGIGTTIPNQKLHVQGNIYASGDITAMSDSRYKTDLQIIQNPLNIIKEIHGYTFTRNDIDSSQRYLGVIAQEVQKVLPEAITENSNGYLSVAYGNLNALLIEGMRELMEELRICKERISLLEQKI